MVKRPKLIYKMIRLNFECKAKDMGIEKGLGFERGHEKRD